MVHGACTRKVAVQERRRLVQHLDQAQVAHHSGTWLKDVKESTLRVLEARGEATAAELSDDEPRLRTSLLMAEGKPYQARQNISTQVLFLLGRRRSDSPWPTPWLPDVKPVPLVIAAGLAAGWIGPSAHRGCQRDLARRWLAAFGPGTIADLQWWSGWTASTRPQRRGAQRKEGDIVFRLLEDVGHDAVVAVVAAAELLSYRIGAVRVTPRFRTPLERELTA